MNKYDNIFNEKFNDEDFNGDPIKKEQARIIFNKMMESMSKVTDNLKIRDDIFKKLMVNIEELDIFDDENFNNKNSIIFPIEESSDGDKGEDLIKQYNLKLETLDLKRKNGFFIIGELWTNKETGYIIKKKYLLNTDIFLLKDGKIQLIIVKKLIEDNYNYIQYLELLNDSTKLGVYESILEYLVEEEKYEEAAEYRDKINDIIL